MELDAAYDKAIKEFRSVGERICNKYTQAIADEILAEVKAILKRPEYADLYPEDAVDESFTCEWAIDPLVNVADAVRAHYKLPPCLSRR